MAVTTRRDGRESGSTSFGTLLKTFRKAAGLTQEQLAEHAGYSTVYVSMLERGQRLPVPATAGALASALGLGSRDSSALRAAARSALGTEGKRPGAGLVGRRSELQRIERHLQGEDAPVLLIGGEPGIGKTRLLREAAQRAGGHGLQVLEGGCLRRGGEEPFAPVLQALQAYIHGQEESRLREELMGCAWLVRLLPELAEGPIEQLPSWSIPPQQERRLMDEAVVRFLANIAGPRGTLLVLDDLQWAATDALDLIRVLAHARSPVRVLGAYRESETGRHHPLRTLLADLAHGGLVGHLMLGPLSEREAADLLEQFLDETSGVSSDLRERVLRQADGVPFFVVSGAQAIRTGALEREHGAGMSWDLTQSIKQRVSLLPEPARDLLGRAAVAGRRIPRSLLIAIGGKEEEVVLDGLDAACQARLLEETEGDGYQFTHDVIREVIEADLGAARRTVLHRQIGEVLERRGGTVEELAYHYARSTDDDNAVRYLELAGEAAARQHANASAEGYFRELVDRLDGLGRAGDAARAREKLGEVLATVARYDDALTVLEQAAQAHRRLGDLEGEVRAAAPLARVHYLKGSTEEGILRLEALRARLETRPALRAAGALNTALAPLLLAQGRYREQLEAAEQAGAIARTLDDDRMLAEADVWRGCALNQLGRLDEGRTLLEAAIPLAEAANDLTSLVHALNDTGFLCEISGEFARSGVYRRRALEIAEQLGDPAALANMTFRCGQTAFLSGDWRAARRYFERSAATARAVDASSILAYPLFGLGLLALAQGDGETVMRHAQECLDIAARTADRQVLRAGHTLLAEKELQDALPDEARVRLHALETDEEGLELHSTLPTLIEACLLAGDPEGARAGIEEGLRRAASSNNRVALVDIMRVQVLALTDGEQWDDAATVLDEALRSARPMPYLYAMARLLFAGGVLHRRMGEPELAQQELSEALALFHRLGASLHARRTEELAGAVRSNRSIR